jgi:hypothetical protein
MSISDVLKRNEFEKAEVEWTLQNGETRIERGYIYLPHKKVKPTEGVGGFMHLNAEAGCNRDFVRITVNDIVRIVRTEGRELLWQCPAL